MTEPDIAKRKEIESHSSGLTNIRIDKLIEIASERGLNILSVKPSAESSMQFFAAIMMWYVGTHPVYAEKVNEPIKKEIDNAIKEGNRISLGFRITERCSNEEIEQLNQLSLRLAYLMTQGLQNLRYFFRLGTTEPRGIDAALEIFNLDIWKPKKKIEVSNGSSEPIEI